MDYATFIETARKHGKASERAYLSLMLLLCEVHDMPGIWQEKHGTFEDVLRKERLCTVKKYTDFRRAVRLKIDVKRLGVDASCLLATYPATIREKAIKATLVWVATHKVPPTYQLVAEFVKTTVPKKPKVVTLADLRRYVKVLQGICTKHGIKYPPEPR